MKDWDVRKGVWKVRKGWRQTAKSEDRNRRQSL